MSGIHLYIDNFIESLLLEEGASRNTVIAYSQDLSSFADIAGVNEPTDITYAAVLKYREKLTKDGMAKATVARKLSALKKFLRWLEAERLIPEYPLPRTFKLPQSAAFPEALPYSEVVALLKAPNAESPQGKRDRAMLEFMYATGIRVSELTGMKVDDGYWAEGQAVVHGKGAKTRTVLFGARTVKYVRDYLENARPQFECAKESRYMWLGRNGALSRIQVYRLVRDYAAKAGLMRKVSPHTLRHSCAMHLLQGGADLRAVQELLGHASIRTIVHYTHFNIEDSRKIYDECHPHGSKKW